MKRALLAGVSVSLVFLGLSLTLSQSPSQAEAQTQTFKKIAAPNVKTEPLELTVRDQNILLAALERNFFGPGDPSEDLRQNWTKAYIPAAIEMYNYVPDRAVRETLLEQLKTSTGQDFGTNTNAWFRWLWNNPELKIKGYDNFKSEFYRQIDPRFGKYFLDRAQSAKIRLDEIRWGGVRQDGIPPLRQPKMITASQASYLEDDNVVFGIEVNGDVRAYPKRILAWHEMFVDTVGGVDFAGVYCTLCGTVILYETDANGISHEMGTSGFLYRSNKLMYDKDTQSLWNTIKGEPVLGPLTGKNIALDHRSVVTTTWGKWKKLHPDTQVLSLSTGHRRDYGEGVAYHQYFADDNLMFHTPFSDYRLKNKTEILALRFKGQPHEPVAISTDFLRKNPVYSGKVGTQKYVVLTDETGANRVYDPKDVTFSKFDGNGNAKDLTGQNWKVSESKLTAPDGRELERLPYHRAFWFGWHATYPQTELIK